VPDHAAFELGVGSARVHCSCSSIERAGIRIDDARYDADGVSAAYLATAI
jgi:hypothetical protein